MGIQDIPYSFEFCFATIGVCVFRVCDFGCTHFFILGEKEMQPFEIRKKDETINQRIARYRKA